MFFRLNCQYFKNLQFLFLLQQFNIFIYNFLLDNIQSIHESIMRICALINLKHE